jgi:ATP-dependent Clp protease ATP-binding subunit ClpC
MTLRRQLKQSRLYPLFVLEAWLPHQRRHQLLHYGRQVVFFTVLVAGLTYWQIFNLPVRLVGLAFVATALWISLYLLEFYFRSHYLKRVLSNEYGAGDLVTITVGRVLYRAHDGDVLAALAASDIGRRLFARLGIGAASLQKFLTTGRVAPLIPINLSAGHVLRLRQLVAAIFSHDKAFADWLFRQEIGGEELLATVDWVVGGLERQAALEQWWSRSNLARLPGLAKDWAFAATYVLDKYSRDLREAPGARLPATRTLSPELIQLETVLTRSREPNALVLSVAGGNAATSLLEELARQLNSGRVTPLLEGRRLILFSTSLLLAQSRTRNDLEAELLRLFNDALRAGNIILVIDDLVNLLLGAETLAVDLLALLDPYLKSSRLPLIALADNDRYEQHLVGRAALMGRFEKVAVSETAANALLGRLTLVAEELEAGAPVLFTYPALVAIARGVEQYFASEPPLDKATDWLTELVPWVAARGLTLVTQDLAQEFLSEKTSVPQGEVGPAEREKLLKLEEGLTDRVIGQQAATSGVAGALRRSRAGVRNPNRPIGSFLFLGPTGVGKTETAKALAAVWFNDENKLLRLDMSEYQAADALNRLIGEAATNRPGVLTTLLRQNPYGVLLLDEFEKSAPDVRNLFLQILDEGFFADMNGKRVNARNLIFIATSNAGAELIWGWSEKDKDANLEEHRRELLDSIISRNLFKPELLNRFDEVILFRPLGPAELKQVAKLMLERLAKRLVEQGYRLTITDGLINAVVSGGADRQFGARPMQRFIQDKIEQPIAEKILSGQLRSGSTINIDNNLNILV